MAKPGAACLLIETMWSDLDFFLKRTQDDDLQNSIQQVVDIRRAMDFLLSQSNIDPNRFAYVGHDFGGMYGVLAGKPGQATNALRYYDSHASFLGLVPVCPKTRR